MAAIIDQLIEHGLLGLILALSLGVNLILWKQYLKKDTQLTDVTEKSVNALSSTTHIISVLSTTTKGIPEKVRLEIIDDLKSIESVVREVNK